MLVRDLKHACTWLNASLRPTNPARSRNNTSQESLRYYGSPSRKGESVLPDLFASQSPTAASVPVPLWLDLTAVFVGSISGLFYARERHLDLLGFVGMAFLCGLGGGLLRDTIMQVGDVYMLRSQNAILVTVVTGILGFLFPTSISQDSRLLDWVDIISVGLFAAAGADKAILYHLYPLPCVFMGAITGVGGGMLRDIFLGEVPHIFRRSNWYAFCAIAGSTVYYICVVVIALDKGWAAAACVFVTLLLRRLSLRFDWYSPSDVDLTPTVKGAAHAMADAAREATSNEMEHALERYERQQALQLHTKHSHRDD